MASEAASPFWPMRVFVHHNPLHGFEHLPFDAAVRKGQDLLGGNGYMANDEYRRLFASGRIHADDLKGEILRLAPGCGPENDVTVGRRRIDPLEVYECHLVFGIDALEPEAFRALVHGQGALRRLCPDLPADRRARLLAHASGRTSVEAENPDAPEGVIDAESQVASALWSGALVALDIAGREPADLHAPGETDAEERIEQEVLAAVARDSETPEAAVTSTGLEWLAGDLGRVGEGMTAGDWCGRLAGVDLCGLINQELIKWCSAFLDQGMAVWSTPGREKGFYRAWRDLAARDFSGRFLGIRGFHRLVDRLPALPEDALIENLRALGIGDKNWSEYIGRHLAQLPGYAGFIKWRSEAHDYAWQQRYPIELVEYLAVRVFYERHLVDACCRDTWGVEGTLPSLETYFRRHPAEYFGRRLSADAPVPDFASRFRPAGGRGSVSDGAWARFGRILYLCRNRLRRDIWTALGRDAWRLFRLAQFLALAPAEVRGMPMEDARALLAILDRLPPDAHGPVWLAAHEARYRNALLSRLASLRHGAVPARPLLPARPLAQAVFCIDVRSEGFRRHLEAVGDCETLGFAGFFGVPIRFRGFGRHGDVTLCPVFVKPKCLVAELPDKGAERDGERTLRGMAWAGILHGLMQRLERHFSASYMMVDLLGGFFGLTLAGRTLFPAVSRRLADRLHHLAAPPVATRLTMDKLGRKEAEDLVAGLDGPVRAARLERLSEQGFTLEEQALYIETGLRLMGLTGSFARLVLLCAHGSTSTNNPYAAALDCGACGGNHGEPNARLFAALANSPAVRAMLRERGIDIPDDTRFIAAEHNTTTDRVVFADTADLPGTHEADFRRLSRDLADAGVRQALDRCARLPGSPARPTPRAAQRHVERRSADLAQVRPEWGLSGNAAFIVAHRSLTRGLDLEGRVFLHSYDWERDAKGAALETIMTAPLIVAEWINMEHYFSTVDNRVYGSGSKVVHNVVGGFGVMLGSGGDIQTGLPRQTVMAGKERYHDPLRLLAVIEAPIDRIGSIIRRHHMLQHLFDNGWVNLVSLDPRTDTFLRYRAGGAWEPLDHEVKGSARSARE